MMEVIRKGLVFLPILFLAHSAGGAEGKLEKATFAGGCFWCMEHPFEKINGVEEVTSGYTGGKKQNPTYQEVSSGATGHFEAVEIIFDPQKVSYKELLDVFWRQIDPTDTRGQFADKGSQYRAAIFNHNSEQKKEAEEPKKALDESGKFTLPVVTEILEATEFYKAEDYHQDYYKKCPYDYKMYRIGSGRDEYIKRMWGEGVTKEKTKHEKPSKKELRKNLTPLQYKVTQECGTERAFDNEYWDNKEEGIYVDIVSGEPLFSSLDKFDSGTGWPSFTKPLEGKNIVEKEDRGLFMVRLEVRSKMGDSHLGHVFNDGPPPTRLRYCINSASLRFIPKDRLEEEGYGEYKSLFKNE